MTKKLVRDTQEVECLIEALMRAVKDRMTHDRAQANYDGYSWGYHGHHYVQAMEKSAEDFAQRLDEYIDKRVQEKLDSMEK